MNSIAVNMHGKELYFLPFLFQIVSNDWIWWIMVLFPWKMLSESSGWPTISLFLLPKEFCVLDPSNPISLFWECMEHGAKPHDEKDLRWNSLLLLWQLSCDYVSLVELGSSPGWLQHIAGCFWVGYGVHDLGFCILSLASFFSNTVPSASQASRTLS